MCLSKMFSVARIAARVSRPCLMALPQKPLPQFRAPARGIFGLVPLNQYENNCIPNRLKIGYALTHYWETIPLFTCILYYFIVVLGYVGLYNGFANKVDTQLSRHDWNCISRNMDLRNPTIHKILTLYQRYEPWPEMQNVLDKMKQAEHRAQSRIDYCGSP